ncbi:MAG: hypothetical protein IPK82_09950 [Polyangiaceae bacterium]|nr:hypothetical protein [Polyangiaceae bacterium]
MLRHLRYFVFLFALACVGSFAQSARADTATAQALFDQGKKLMGEKKYAEACPKFEESQRLDPGLGTQINLASCYAELGKYATAWSLYLDVASQAKSAGQADREKKARDAAKALEPKLSKLTIEVAVPVDGLEVRRNGQLVGQATWGTPIPVDPGDIKITAMAPNKKLWETAIVVDKEKPGDQTVKVPELEKGKTPVGYGQGTQPGPNPTATYYGQGQPPPPQVPRMKRRSSGMFGGGIAMVVVGPIVTLTGIGWLAIAEEAGTGAGLLAGGLLLTGGGIAMIVIGGKKVPVEEPAKASLPFVPVSPIPEVRVGLGSVEATWEF